MLSPKSSPSSKFASSLSQFPVPVPPSSLVPAAFYAARWGCVPQAVAVAVTVAANSFRQACHNSTSLINKRYLTVAAKPWIWIWRLLLLLLLLPILHPLPPPAVVIIHLTCKSFKAASTPATTIEAHSLFELFETCRLFDFYNFSNSLLPSSPHSFSHSELK